jgi:hypothetical protein
MIIQLTTHDSRTVAIELRTILSYEKEISGNGSTVYLSEPVNGAVCYIVRETPLKIAKLMIEAYELHLQTNKIRWQRY